MDRTQIVAASVMTALLVAATYTDIRYSKIFNAVTVPAAILGIVVNSVGHGVHGLVISLGGIALGLALLPVCALLGRLLGGGDIKLLAAVGALQGPYVLLWACGYTAIAGGVLAVSVALWRRSLRAAVTRLGHALGARLAANTTLDIQTADAKARLPYAIAIALGSLIAVYAIQLH